MFYSRSPRKFSYNSVLADKNLTFNKFKQLKNKSIDATPQHRRHSSFEYDSEKVEPDNLNVKSKNTDLNNYEELGMPRASKTNSRNIPEIRSRSLNVGKQAATKSVSTLRIKPAISIQPKPNKQIEQQRKSIIVATKIPLK